MRGTNNWVSGDKAERAMSVLSATKRQFNADVNARIRLIKDARTSPNVPPHIEALIRAPLHGLR